MTNKEKALEMHKQWNGKLSVEAKCQVASAEDLAIAYTPGVAEPCRAIAKNPKEAYTYTIKSNTVAVVSDGSAVLGLGNIGALAAMPVMEGKAALFKEFGGVNAFPICLDTQDTEEIIETVVRIAPAFGGINLEDIAAPRCFEIEERLDKMLDIPVFHDDQHGTAIVVCAALVNALKLAEKQNPTIVINGAGSAGVAIATLILKIGLGNVILVDKQGILTADMDLTSGQRGLIDKLNKEGKTGSLKDALVGADVFIGVSAGHIVSKEMIASMNEKAIVFPMANPVPEIEPDDAKEAGAYIVGTGRSDHPNQINNVLAFPGIFKGALKAGATCINDAMKEAAVYAISSMGTEDMLDSEHIIVSALDPRVADVVAQAVADAAKESGVVRE
mgnify:CR=1 FL=1